MVGYENGPRRQEFDGYTFFGVEDEDDGLLPSSSGQSKDHMNDFIIPTVISPSAMEDSMQRRLSLVGDSYYQLFGKKDVKGRQFYIQFDP